MNFHYHANGTIHTNGGTMDADEAGVTVSRCPDCGRWGLLLQKRSRDGRKTFFWGQGNPKAPDSFNGLPIAWVVAQDITRQQVKGWKYAALAFVPPGQRLPIFPVYWGNSHRHFLGDRGSKTVYSVTEYPTDGDFSRYRDEYTWLLKPGGRALYGALREKHLRMLVKGFKTEPRPYPWKINLLWSSIRKQTVSRYAYQRGVWSNCSCICHDCGAPCNALYVDLMTPLDDSVPLCAQHAAEQIAVKDIPWLKGRRQQNLHR